MDMEFSDEPRKKNKKGKKSKKSRREVINTDSDEESPTQAPPQRSPQPNQNFEDSNSDDQNSSVDNMAPRNHLNNMPFDNEKSVEVKSIGTLDGIKCCMFFDLEKGLKIMIIIASIDFLYTLGNMFFGLLFYVVGKSKEITVNEATGQLVTGNSAVNKVNDSAIDLLQKQQQLSLSDNEALKFGWVLGSVSFMSLVPMIYIIRTFYKYKAQQTEEDRTKIVWALDVWIYKSTLWYLAVSVAFMVIMLDQESNQLITLIITGIVTFVMLFWWRTSFTDSLDRIESYKLEQSLADRAVAYNDRREKLNEQIKDRTEGQHLEEFE